jgi:Transposase, Mutator family
LALMEMYVEGVSTRKVKESTEELCGTSFSKSLVSSLAGSLDSELEGGRSRRLEAETYPLVRIFPTRRRACGWGSALAVEQSEEWVTGRRYLDMEELREHRRSEEREKNGMMLMQR